MMLLAAESEKHRDSTPLGRIYKEYEMLLQKTPVNVKVFEKILGQIDSSIKGAYQANMTSEGERKTAEGQMLIQGEIPQVLVEPVKQLLFQASTLLKREINEAELYFTDVSRLGLTNDDYSRRRNHKNPIDSIRKTPLRQDCKIRRCTRCCSLMEDIIPHRSINPVLALMARSCYCGSSWMILDNYENDQQDV